MACKGQCFSTPRFFCFQGFALGTGVHFLEFIFANLAFTAQLSDDIQLLSARTTHLLTPLGRKVSHLASLIELKSRKTIDATVGLAVALVTAS
jgi:hypothetical protein